mmetsp:Transcript_19035/g.45980  ORF Transcript_19035/g.45980 Transcript_19035/m.45980 type:complete len:219 (-) Transcript_19035:8-664(-)
MVYRLTTVSKCAFPTSTVFPFALSSSFVSMMNARNHDSRFNSLASRSYFSIVRLSTFSVMYRILPDNVDFPASTWPMKTRFRCSLGSPSLSDAGSTSSTSSSASTSFAGAGAGAAAGVSAIVIFSSTSLARPSVAPPSSPDVSIGSASPARIASTSGYCVRLSGSLIIWRAFSRSPSAIFKTTFHNGSFSSTSDSVVSSRAGGAGAGIGAGAGGGAET